MFRRRLFALFLAAACAPLAGCRTHITRPVDVIVTHADTGEPAAGVPVEAKYLGLILDFRIRPDKAAGTTDADGRVTLPLGDFDGLDTLSVGTDCWAFWAAHVREGGALDRSEMWDPPKYHVRLVARERWLVRHWLPPYAPWYGTRTDPP